MSLALRHARKIAFALGAVSLTSWYSVFVLGLLHFSPAPLGTLLGIYGALLLIAVSISQLVENILSGRVVEITSESE